jgi:hypothetical protein
MIFFVRSVANDTVGELNKALRKLTKTVGLRGYPSRSLYHNQHLINVKESLQLHGHKN